MPNANTNATSANSFVTDDEEFSVEDRPQQTASVITSGWAAAEDMTPKTEGFPTECKLNDKPQVLKFIDQNGPFAAFKQHFLTGKPGKKSYICLNSKGQNNNCPLCSVLHNKAEDKRAFTVINFSAEGGPQKQILLSANRLYKSLHNAEFSPQGPLTKPYWGLSRTGEKAAVVYNLQAIKSRDLNEDWNISEQEAEEFVSSATPFSASLYRENSYAELMEIAQEMMGTIN
jgi:hypothetical protein